MTQIPWGLTAAAAIWVIALLHENTRNFRFLIALLVLTIASMSATWVTGASDRLATVGPLALVLGGGLAILRPELLGLSSVSSSSRRIDRELHAAMELLRQPDSREQGRVALDALMDSHAILPEDWYPVVRLLREHAHRLDHGQGLNQRPADSFRTAANAFWQAALWKNVVGDRRRPQLWAEEALLVSFHDEFRRQLPFRRLSLVNPPDSGDVAGAERVVADLSKVALRSEEARAARDALLLTMETEIRIVRGDRSPPALQLQERQAAAMREVWSTLRGLIKEQSRDFR